MSLSGCDPRRRSPVIASIHPKVNQLFFWGALSKHLRTHAPTQNHHFHLDSRWVSVSHIACLYPLALFGPGWRAAASMAALTDRTYFPPLGDCLTGKNIILYVAVRVACVSSAWFS